MIQSEYIDENGYLTEDFSKQVQLFIESYVDRTASGAILTLQDFDFDNVPEIVYSAHNGGQGEQESKVYRAWDFHYYGSFNGFCRDGYTKFSTSMTGLLYITSASIPISFAATAILMQLLKMKRL